jgi:Pentapeptide repeats (8 copies)
MAVRDEGPPLDSPDSAHRRWHGRWPRRLLRTAVLAVLAALAWLVWSRWGLAVLAVAAGIAVVGGLVVWVVVIPGRLAPPVPAETLNEITDPRVRMEVADARTRLRHDLRNGALQLLTVLAVLVGAGLGFQQLAEDRDQASQDRDQAIQDRQLTRQGQASERFTRAIDQLGSSRVETRIGGIYGLDQIAEQSPEENTGPVGEVLLAWLNGRPRPRTPPDTPLSEHAPDVQAALSVLTRQRYSSRMASRLDLHGLGLGGADLRRAFLGGADLRGANLFNADLVEANLGGAILHYAVLRDAFLEGADLRDAVLGGAVLGGADLRGADLRGAYLDDADLGGANLRGADLRGAFLGDADLDSANLSGANLRGADLTGADLRGADLRAAQVDGETIGPTGYDWRQAGAQVVP